MRGLPVLAALGLLAACSGTAQSSTPPPQTTANATPPAATASFTLKAPPVRDPLDASVFIRKPATCDLLTAAQRATLGISGGRWDKWRCNFTVTQPDASVIAELTVNGMGAQGLTTLYSLQEQRRLWMTWQPTEAGGYPAVRYSEFPPSLLPAMVCEFAIGVADAQYLNVRYYYWDGHAGQDTCGPAEHIATEVLATLSTHR